MSSIVVTPGASRLLLLVKMCPTIINSTAPYPDLFPSQCIHFVHSTNGWLISTDATPFTHKNRTRLCTSTFYPFYSSLAILKLTVWQYNMFTMHSHGCITKKTIYTHLLHAEIQGWLMTLHMKHVITLFSPPPLCMSLLVHKNTGQNHNIKAGHKSFENVAYYKHCETLLISQNCTHEEIQSRLSSRNAFIQEIKYLSSYLVSKSVKIKAYAMQFCL